MGDRAGAWHPITLRIGALIHKLTAFTLAASLLTTTLLAQDVQTKQYDTGGVYTGEFKDGKQHGEGKYTLPNGYEYEGDWVDGRIEGQGVAKFPNGSVYTGAFENGSPSGSGKIVFADGGTYEGQCANG